MYCGCNAGLFCFLLLSVHKIENSFITLQVQCRYVVSFPESWNTAESSFDVISLGWTVNRIVEFLVRGFWKGVFMIVDVSEHDLRHKKSWISQVYTYTELKHNILREHWLKWCCFCSFRYPSFRNSWLKNSCNTIISCLLLNVLI